VSVVTGDTKVVPRGAVDGLFVNTSGNGRLRSGVDLGIHRVRPGDRVLVSGTLGDHGIAVLAAREGMELQSPLPSDTAPLFELVQSLFDSGIDVHFLRDPTRGGVSAVLHEVTGQTAVSVLLEEQSLPVSAGVRGACEILGLDPLYVANEGKLLAIVASADADRAVACLRRHPLGKAASAIGEVTAESPPQVLIRGLLGSVRVVDEPSGAPLPRIC
jgi:hydrogenase expression/formation protein HypE